MSFVQHYDPDLFIKVAVGPIGYQHIDFLITPVLKSTEALCILK